MLLIESWKRHDRDQNLARRATTETDLSSSTTRHQRPSVVLDDSPSPFLETPTQIEEALPTARLGLDAALKQQLIDNLYFDQIDGRLTNIAPAFKSTCQWFFEKDEYKSWHDASQSSDHSGFLWIKGNPGTGKSTLMKVLFQRANTDARTDPHQICLSFFFNARGVVEEKSTTGLYRSLLHQLFRKAKGLTEGLEWMTVDGARGVARNGWHEQALKQTLARTVEQLGNHSLTIFVDALDECDQKQAADMVSHFEELCERAREMQVTLRICFSSRHYPDISIQNGIETVLEDEEGHKADIQSFIKSRLRLGASKATEALREEILAQSSQSFLWVVLVVHIVNAEFRYPTSPVSIKKIQTRVKDIPPQQHDLFEMILTQDGVNLDQLRICLNIILFAFRPLDPQELYFAVQLGLDSECSTLWDQADVEPQQMKKFVRTYSKGLAEVTRNKAAKVQFIHESVRDFLLGKYRAQWSGAAENIEGQAHELLRDCCFAQLKATIDGIPDPLPPAREMKHTRQLILTKYPFLEYSVLNLFRHVNRAQSHGLPQGPFLDQLINMMSTRGYDPFVTRPIQQNIDSSSPPPSLLYIYHPVSDETWFTKLLPEPPFEPRLELLRLCLQNGKYLVLFCFLWVKANQLPSQVLLRVVLILGVPMIALLAGSYNVMRRSRQQRRWTAVFHRSPKLAGTTSRWPIYWKSG